MTNQKVMLISLCPTYSALYKPLFTIKFFREICLALFGDVEPSERLIKEFYDSKSGHIYWTHYYKCFMQSAFKNPDRLNPAKVCESHLINEIQALDPELIIILGKETVENLFAYTLKTDEVLTEADLPVEHSYFMNRKIFCTDFPNRGDFKRFEQIRNTLQKYIPWIHVACKQQVSVANEEYMELEYENLSYMHSKAVNLNISETDRKWIENIIYPNASTYNVVMQTYSFIESSIKSLLMDRLRIENNQNVIAQIRTSKLRMDTNNKISDGDLCNLIKKPWLEFFKQIADFALKTNNYISYRDRIRNLDSDIRNLRNLRNTISHNGGTVISSLNRYQDGNIEGVYTYGNTIFISENGVENILKIGRDFLKIYSKVYENI